MNKFNSVWTLAQGTPLFYLMKDDAKEGKKNPAP